MASEQSPPHDDVAEALYLTNHLVPAYTKSKITPLKNNYNWATPDPSYIPEWRLTLDGLASGLSVSLNIRNLLASFQLHEQITRLVCVEGWSAIAWWAGFRFDDLLRALPAYVPGEMAPAGIIGQSRPLGESRPVLRVARSVDGASSADPARDSPERKASHSGTRSSAATACTCETRSEEHQSDNADCLYSQQIIGQSADIHAMTEFESLSWDELRSNEEPRTQRSALSLSC